MSTSAATMMVYATGHLACIKISGRANFTASFDFRTLSEELVAKGFSCFVLDVSDCLLMDSTFLGNLAGFGLKLAVPAPGQRHVGSIEILNPNARISDSLENLGIAHLFKMVHCQGVQPAQLAATAPVTAANPSKADVTKTCLDAHKTLMSVAPANVAKFKEVTQFLAEDLKKLDNGN